MKRFVIVLFLPFLFVGCQTVPPIDAGALASDLGTIRETVETLPNAEDLGAVVARIEEAEDVLSAVDAAPEEDKAKVIADKILPLVPEPYASYAAVGMAIWAIIERRRANKLTKVTT